MLPWSAILNRSRALAAWEQPSQTPDPSTDPSLLHSPCTTHFTPNLSMGLFYPSSLLPPDQSGKYSPHLAGSSLLCYFDALILLFHKEKVHPAGILAGLLSVPHVPPLGKRPLHRHPAMAFLPTYLLPSFSPTSNLALSVLTQYKPAPIVSHILAFPPQYVTDRKAIPQLDYKGCAGNHKSA